MQRFARSFQIWDYWVSHSQLLLRSAADVSNPRNLDLLFVGVQYLELPTVMPDLELADASSEEQERATLLVGRPIPPEQVFVLVTGGRRYMVVAGGMRVAENDLPFMKSSLERR